jgi:hypothetical protein
LQPASTTSHPLDFTGADGLTRSQCGGDIAATAGMTTTDVAAQGITAALNAYGMQATDAGKVSDIMFQTVNDGVDHLRSTRQQHG